MQAALYNFSAKDYFFTIDNYVQHKEAIPLVFQGVQNQERVVFGVIGACFAAKLIGGEQARIGQPCATVGQVDDAADLGGKALPDIREQPFQCGIERSLRHVGPGAPDLSHVGQVSLYRVFVHDRLFRPVVGWWWFDLGNQ